MFKALLSKQIREIVYSLSGGNKKGSRLSAGKLAAYVLLFVFVGLSIGFMLYQMMDMICYPLLVADMGWLYFALSGIMATALGIFGSVFAAQSQLFEAKDNELLLSLPLPSGMILFCRMAALYLQTMVLMAVVLIPTIIVYWQYAYITVIDVLIFLLILVFLPLLGLALACLLGWLVAIISSHLPNKHIMTVILTLGFLALYYYLIFNIYPLMQNFLDHSREIGDTVSIAFYPLYQMGMALMGNIISFLIFAAICFAAILLVYLLLSHSFFHIVGRNNTQVKKNYREKIFSSQSVNMALFKREWLHLLNNPMYLLNCASGSLFMVIGSVLIMIFAGKIQGFFTMFTGIEPYLPVLAAALLGFMSAMNIITAPSISLEGRSIWLLKSLPVTAKQIFNSKLQLHMLICGVPVLICCVAISIAMGFSLLNFLLLTILSVVFSLLMGVFGLMMNLRFPNLEWSSEIVLVKQGMSVMVSLFGGWGILIVCVGLCFLLKNILTPTAFLAVLAFILILAVIFIFRWLRTKGERIFIGL